MNFSNVGKRQMSRIINATVKKSCSEIEFENSLAIASQEPRIVNASSNNVISQSAANETISEIELDSSDDSTYGFSDHSSSSDENSLEENSLDDNEIPSTNCNSPSGSDEVTKYLKENLSRWSSDHSITHVAMNHLLGILIPIYPNLPKDARTIMQTPRELKLKQLSTGHYYHMGLSNALRKLHLNETKEILLDFNIDGLPLYKSSNTSFWPILGKISGFFHKPFVIGIFCGPSKPLPLDVYLEDFIAEVKNLLLNGININGKDVKINLREIFADRITFPATKSAPRTDSSFADLQDDEHHRDVSPLSQIPGLGMVTSFVLDYMHLVCLGVTRKLILIWTSGKVPILKLSSRMVDEISERLKCFSKNVPTEFSRKPRSLREVKRWKATEFRQFLLYTGPVVLKDCVPLAIYQNFLLLHSAIFLLVHDISKSNLAEQFLSMFVVHSCELYGMYHIVSFPATEDSEEEVEIIHNLWVLPDRKSCYFPPFLRGQHKKALKTVMKPDPKSWKVYNMRIIHTLDTYENSIEHHDEEQQETLSQFLPSRVIKKCKTNEILTPRSQQVQVTPFQKKVLRWMAEMDKKMEETNMMLTSILLHLQESNDSNNIIIDEEFQLPVKTLEEFKALENFIDNASNCNKLVKYLSKKGGNGVADTTKRILKTILHYGVAMQFNWAGRGDKEAFKDSKIKMLVISAVRESGS
ncbi:hypothetical protein JTE90_024254 [Oedothorax gibbosus]|uniref:DUF4806 domain-containing protein n=1 Tax=Oedothorax gibbosus TaxID=931172 RepID=A0AAV6VQ51_9ARAC|nr:hypothetical protein JTE90_024254 [Oedothorax gibbosus]